MQCILLHYFAGSFIALSYFVSEHCVVTATCGRVLQRVEEILGNFTMVGECSPWAFGWLPLSTHIKYEWFTAYWFTVLVFSHHTGAVQVDQKFSRYLHQACPMSVTLDLRHRRCLLRQIQDIATWTVMCPSSLSQSLADSVLESVSVLFTRYKSFI